MTRRAAVLGSPVGHSLSPVLHHAAYDALGLTGWVYTAHDVDEPALAGFLAGLDPTWVGLSLTMPLKQAVLPLLDEASPVVTATAAANTVLLADGRLAGENTDVPGIVAALSAAGLSAPADAAVLGGGATARSAVAALARTGARVTAAVRTPARADGLEATAAALGARLAVRPWTAAADLLSAPVVVSTTPAGASDPLASLVPASPGLLLDVVYEPWPTPLAAAWAARGGTVLGGLDLLVHQAVLQVGLMTGRAEAVPRLVAPLRAAAHRALRRG
jgi:shikimate dehydrogenase